MRKVKNIHFNIQMIFLSLLCILFLLPSITNIQAKEMSLQEAIRWGVANNYDLKVMRNMIEELKNNLEILDAAESFQVDLGITPIWHFGKSQEDTIQMSKNSLTPSAEMKLVATKPLVNNMNLSTELSWESESLSRVDFEEMASQLNASISLTKKVYPQGRTENEKKVYSIENNLQMKLEELKWEEMGKQIEFIEDYLHIIRLRRQVDIARERMELAEKTLIRVKKQISLGEGGYQQETEAEIALREIKNKTLDLEQSLSWTIKQWSLALCLPEDTVVQFEENTSFVQQLFSRMNTLEIDPDNFETRDDLIDKTLEKNYRIKNSQLEKEELIKELEWTEDEGKPMVNLSGGYQYPDNWFMMVDFSVNLADGGAQELKEEQKEVNINQKEMNITYLMEQLKLETEQLLNQDRYNQVFWDIQLLTLEKEQDKFEIMEKQYQLGVISQEEYKNELLILEEKEMNVKLAEDQWFINRLKLAHFLGELKKEV